MPWWMLCLLKIFFIQSKGIQVPSRVFVPIVETSNLGFAGEGYRDNCRDPRWRWEFSYAQEDQTWWDLIWVEPRKMDSVDNYMIMWHLAVLEVDFLVLCRSREALIFFCTFSCTSCISCDTCFYLFRFRC